MPNKTQPSKSHSHGSKSATLSPAAAEQLNSDLHYLKLTHLADHWSAISTACHQKQLSFSQSFSELICAETRDKKSRAIARRLKCARFPVTKTLEEFDFSWPQKINHDAVRHLFTLHFMPTKANVVWLGGVGLGKTHLASALGYAACQRGHRVLFTNTIDMINRLGEAMRKGTLNHAMKTYTSPELLLLDELGYLPIDQRGADLLFQVISARYERSSTVITSNKAYSQWAKIFNNDSALTSAVLDRLLHRCETVQITGKSYRMKDRLD